jgi:hypothetical protein
MRADAAATAAKVDGSPVATNGKQEAELREWKIVSHDRFHRVVNRANDQWFDLLYIDDAARLYQVLNAFASLHAYVKAELREWQCKFANHNFIVSRQGDSPAFSCIFEGSGEWLAKTLNSHASLHAYAKALDLRDKWYVARCVDDHAIASSKELAAFDAHLRSMGWDGRINSDDFLGFYRAAALAGGAS